MIERRCAGEIPKKHHIAFKDRSGAMLYEHCFTRQGFDGPYSILYHRERPHLQEMADGGGGFETPVVAKLPRLAKRHYVTPKLGAVHSQPLKSRQILLFNRDVSIGICRPSQEDTAYFANGDADEVFFIFKGSGVMRSIFGDLRFSELDYVCVPRGVLHRWIPDDGVEQHWLAIECFGDMGLPKQWRNDVGQLRMDAPFSHRDFRAPEFVGPQDEGIRQLVVKRNHAFSSFKQGHSPLDVVGWDGTVYPFVFPILNFQPRAGLVHLPPDWHGTFAARGALICSFVPRVVDFHPEAVPCPYPHSSVHCDEVLFYCRGNFTSRKGVGPGSISHHPAGIPHGPHPGSYEASIGTTRTDELAVMLDTFEPLQATRAALAAEDQSYHQSFVA